MLWSRRMLMLGAGALAVSPLALAASVDGVWLISRKSGKGEELEFELKLKADGANLTGAYGRKGARRTIPIQDGKVSGDAVSFTTVQKSKKGENKLVWKGTISGDELKGEMGRAGRRTRAFSAKRVP